MADCLINIASDVNQNRSYSPTSFSETVSV